MGILFFFKGFLLEGEESKIFFGEICFNKCFLIFYGEDILNWYDESLVLIRKVCGV